MNRDFFVAHKERTSGTCMRVIRDASGILVIDPDHVMDIATDFYAKLFMVEPVLDGRTRLGLMFGPLLKGE